MNQHRVARSGYRPDTVDPRDHPMFARHLALTTPPRRAQTSSGMPPVVDQGNEGACTGNGLASMFDYYHPNRPVSARRFIYANELIAEGTWGTDAGAMPRDGLKVLKNIGVPPESLCKYRPGYDFKVRPSKAAYTAAAAHKIGGYTALFSVDEVVAAIAAHTPVGIGAALFKQFESDEAANTGVITLPAPGERDIGGHFFVACDYDLDANIAICRNSWGPWGMPTKLGYFTLPLLYLANRKITSDMWTMRL